MPKAKPTNTEVIGVDYNTYMINIMEQIAKVQQALSEQVGHHIEEDKAIHRRQDKNITEISSQVKELGKKIEARNPAAVDSIYIGYIERLINEVADWYNIQPDTVKFPDVRRYRNMSKNTHELRLLAIRTRLLRLKNLRGIENVHIEFKQELCERIGITEGQIRMEPQAIAIYFNDSCNAATFNQALELNKENMKVAKDVIFWLEEKYGIYDADREYSADLVSRIEKDRDNVSKYNDVEYVVWFQQFVKEYRRICKTTNDKATKLIFEYVGRIASDRKYFDTCTFSGNVIVDIHKILSDKHLRVRFPDILVNNFIGMW